MYFSLLWYMGLFLPSFRTWHFPLLSFQRFLLAHLCALSRRLWMAACSSAVSAPLPRFLPSANSLRMRSVLSSRSLMEKFKCGHQYWPAECTTGLKSPVRFHVGGYKPLNSPTQPTSSLLHCLFYTVHTWAVHLWECYGGQCWKSCQIQS